MDRSRDARRGGSLLVSSNGLSRRRHRSGLRDSPDEDGQVELQESVRLRERVKKDRERDRERERERPSTIRTSKRRRGENTVILGINKGDDGGEDTSEESVNYEEDDDNNNHDHHHNSGGGVRLLPPNQNSVAVSAISPVSSHYHNGNSNNSTTHNLNSNYTNSNNYNTNHQHQNQNLQTRKSIPPSARKVFRAPPVWKSDEMIGVSVPRKARSASTKRSHEWISNNTVGGVNVAGGEQINLQISNSLARPPSIDLPTAPLSPSYSNASAKKKIKQNGSKQPKQPKSSSKTSSLNPGELEIEIAEVLFGLKTQSPASLKEIVANNSVEINRSSSNAKLRVSSPVSNSPIANIQSSPTVLPNFCSSGGGGSFKAVAPKRKKPRHVTENITGSFSDRSNPVLMKVETDRTLKILEKIDENGVCKAKSGELPAEQNPTSEDLESKPVAEGFWESPDVVSKKELVISSNKEIPVEGTECILENVGAGVTVTALASTTIINSVAAVTLDLEASPPGLRSSPGRGEIHTAVAAAIEHKQVVSNVDVESKPLEDEKLLKLGKSEVADAIGEDLKLTVSVEESEAIQKVKKKGRNGDVHLDQKKQEKDDVIINKLVHQSQKQPPQAENSGHSSPLPMSMQSWPGGLPPMGYMAPIQGVVTMDGSTVSPVPVQAIVKQPRPKRCATHCHIARNIHYLQQFIKINPFWQPPAAASKLSNFSVVPPQTNVNGSISGGLVGSNVQDKAPVLAASQPNNVGDASQRNQQILLQQSLPQVVPNNMLHGGPAFFFHLNQQQAAAARPGMVAVAVAAKQANTSTSSTMASSASSAAAMSGGGTATGFSFSYPNMAAANETQYVAIVPNSYPFPIPAATAAAVSPPNYRGGGTHSQPMPMFNGSFFSSQIIHPSQLQHQSQQQQQQQQPISQSSHQMQQNLKNSNLPSGSSSSSQKHQGSAGPAVASGNVSEGNRQLQQRSQQRQQNLQISSSSAQHHHHHHHRVENEAVIPEDSLTSGDSRGGKHAATVNIYGQHMHSQNYALMASSTPSTLPNGAITTGSNNNQNEKKFPEQQPVKTATESLSQFTYINGAPGFDLSSMAQNPAYLQGLRESTTHNIQTMTAQAQQQRKNVRNSEDSSAAMAAQTSMSNTMGPVSISNAQLPQNAQQMMQQLAAVRAKYNSTINVNGGYPSAEQLSSSMASPQWKNTVRNSTSQSPSSALKNHPQHQNKGLHLNHTQISFGSTQKSTSGGLQGGQPLPLSSSNQSPSSPMMVGSPTTSSMSKGANGSPRTASVPAHNIISTSQVSSFSPQHVKNSSLQPQNSSPVGVKNPNVSSTSSSVGGAKPQLQQQQMQKLPKDLQQTQLYFSNHQPQFQSVHPGAGGTNSNPPPAAGGGGYYIQRWRQDQQQQQQLGVVTSTTSSSTGMLTSCPVSLSGGGTTDPAKAIAAATVAATTMKGGYLQSRQLSSTAFSYGGHTVPVTVQVNKPVEQKQQAGNDNSHAC